MKAFIIDKGLVDDYCEWMDEVKDEKKISPIKFIHHLNLGDAYLKWFNAQDNLCHDFISLNKESLNYKRWLDNITQDELDGENPTLIYVVQSGNYNEYKTWAQSIGKYHSGDFNLRANRQITIYLMLKIHHIKINMCEATNDLEEPVERTNKFVHLYNYYIEVVRDEFQLRSENDLDMLRFLMQILECKVSYLDIIYLLRLDDYDLEDMHKNFKESLLPIQVWVKITNFDKFDS